MNTSLKKFTGLFLAVLMLLSVISVGASAADTGANASGAGSSFKFTDNQNWGTVYMHAWTSDSDLTTWPGEALTEKETNSLGETVFTVNVPDGAVGVVLNNDNGSQTTDIDNFSVKGYYTDSKKTDAEGKLIPIAWPDDGGSDDDGNDDPPEIGTLTAYLNPGDFSGYEWYAWSWNFGGPKGQWYTGTAEGSYIKFTDLCDTVIFAAFPEGNGTPDSDWTGKVGQTGDEGTVDGQLFSVTSGEDGVDTYGNPITSFSGTWEEFGGDITTEPTTDAPTDEPTGNTTDAPTDAPTNAPTDAPTGTPAENPTDAPETTPQKPGLVIPTDAPAADENENLYISAKSNLNTTGVKVKTSKNFVTVTYTLTTPAAIDDIQASVLYDSSKIELSNTYNNASSLFPVAKDTAYNLNAGVGEMSFNFSGTNGKYDFTKSGVLVNLVFAKKSGATGTAYVYGLRIPQR